MGAVEANVAKVARLMLGPMGHAAVVFAVTEVPWVQRADAEAT
jgi:hypothetical protein